MSLNNPNRPITIDQLKAAITTHPNNLTMDAFCYVQPALAQHLSLEQLQALDLTNPPPGVRLCICGWILALAGHHACGVTITEPSTENCYYLTRHQASPHHAALRVIDASQIPHPRWNLLPDPFFLTLWPAHLQSAYRQAAANQDGAAMAAAMCAIIDYYFRPQPT